MNTVKASNEYIRLCENVLKAKDQMNYFLLAAEAISYGNAIKDICGSQVWLSIVTMAESLMPEDVQTVAGIPTSFQPEKVTA